MFVRLKSAIEYKMPDGTIRRWKPGDVINVGKYPGLAKAISGSPQDKMVRPGAVKKKSDDIDT